MAFPIDSNKSARENLLALVNHANSSDLTFADIDFANLQGLDGKVEGERNTSVLLDPLAGGRFSVAAGGVTVNYRRLSFAELIQAPVEIKATRTTTLDEIHQAVCQAYGLITDGVTTEGVLPGPGTIMPGDTFEVIINPSQEGGLVYYPKAQPITITWDGVMLEALLTNTDLAGYAAAEQRELIYSLSFNADETSKYSIIGWGRVDDYQGNRVLYGSESEEVSRNKSGIEIKGANHVDLATRDFDLEFKYLNLTETDSAQTALGLGTDGGYGYTLTVGLVGNNVTLYGMPGGTIIKAAPSYVKGAWNKYTLKRRGLNIEVLVNDETVYAATGKDTGYDSLENLLTGNIKFGTADGVAKPYTNYGGHLDDLRIYSVG